MSKRLTISPSGSYYGSEQVLHDYLSITSLNFDILAPEKSHFIRVLKQSNLSHNIQPFNNKYLFITYFLLVLKLFISKNKIIYLNEAGHIKYIILLSKIFKSTKFIVHVRIIEDTNRRRWPNRIGSNVTVISISKYIQKKLPFDSIQLYDLYKFDTLPSDHQDLPIHNSLQIGVVGRITSTKGLKALISIIEKSNIYSNDVNIIFNLFGHISDHPNDTQLIKKLQSFSNVIFRGFEDKNVIYSTVHCILHCSVQEALGRIYLESIDFLKPFVGFKEGGIGEIGNLVGLSRTLLDANDIYYPEKAVDILLKIKNNYEEHIQEVKSAKEIAKNIFSVSNYTTTLDNLLK